MKKSDKPFVVDALCSDRVVRKAIVLRRPPGKVWEAALIDLLAASPKG